MRLLVDTESYEAEREKSVAKFAYLLFIFIHHSRGLRDCEAWAASSSGDLKHFKYHQSHWITGCCLEDRSKVPNVRQGASNRRRGRTKKGEALTSDVRTQPHLRSRY